MRRTYRLHIIVEGTFERKVKAKTEAERLLRSLRVKSPWTKAGTKVTSKAKPAPKAPRPPTADETFRAGILEHAKRIVGELRLVDPRLPRVTVRWLNDGGCGYSTGNPAAHAHRGKSWVRREPYRSVALPRNLICLVAPWHIRHMDRDTGEPSSIWSTAVRIRVPYDDERMADLMAHEIMHMRFHNGRHGRGRGHRSKAFHDGADAVVSKWKAWKAGTFAPPPRPTPNFTPLRDLDFPRREWCNVCQEYLPKHEYHLVSRDKIIQVHTDESETRTP